MDKPAAAALEEKNLTFPLSVASASERVDIPERDLSLWLGTAFKITINISLRQTIDSFAFVLWKYSPLSLDFSFSVCSQDMIQFIFLFD